MTFREKLAAILPGEEHWLLFDAKGCTPPPSNGLSVPETYAKFKSDFLPQCPISDPRGEKVKIRRNNFPKFLNLAVKPGLPSKKASTIVDLIEAGRFVASEYTWAKDRIQALFWVPDVIRTPDAIYRKKRNHGLINADEVYVKVYDRMGSNIKLVFVDRVGKHDDVISITSYLTGAHTAVKYCDGRPVWSK